MKTSEVLHAWSRILTGHAPNLSIEITKECPLRCPGCYAFDPAHLGGESQLRELSDFRGDELVSRTLALIDRLQALHVSIVGGDPLVRYREVDQLIPQIDARGIHTQLVTSAFRVIPASWAQYKRLNIVVSIDGLAPEHDVRRKPATYDRILKNIADAHINVHCTITSQIADRPGYLEEFLTFWCPRPEVTKVWFSIFTPQRGATDVEILSQRQRATVIAELKRLRLQFPKLEMPIPFYANSEIRPPALMNASSRARRAPSPPTSRRESLHANSAAIPTALNADASHQWLWPRSATIAWLGTSPQASSSLCQTTLARAGTAFGKAWLRPVSSPHSPRSESSNNKFAGTV